MIEKIKSLNEALPQIFFIDMLYLILGEIIIFLVFSSPMIYAVGFLAGVLYAGFASLHMSYRIREVVYGKVNTTKVLLIGYFIRLAVMIMVFAALYYFNIGDLLAALVGMFAMKVSAYLQPITNRISSKIF